MYCIPLHYRCGLAPFISRNTHELSLTSCRWPPKSLCSECLLLLCTLTLYGHERATQHVINVFGKTGKPHLWYIRSLIIEEFLYLLASQAIIVVLAGFGILHDTIPCTIYLPTTFILVAVIYSLHYKCGQQPGISWLAYNFLARSQFIFM